jgi:tyrosine-protein phosphatase SIW14
MTDTSLMNVDRNPSVHTERAWAQKMDLAGVPNLHKVSDDLYRGAQPSEEGIRQLKALGIKTLINLRAFHSDRDEIGETNDIDYKHIATQPWAVTNDDIVRFLRIVTDPNRTPVYVHCQRGADRTGTMCAIYRMVVQGWTKEQALQEMTQGGFGFYPGWQDLIDTIRNLDIQQVKKQAELNPMLQ